MERLSMLAFHPVKMQSCYEKVDQLNLEGLQQRFSVASPSVFVGRAQILMGEVRSHRPFLVYFGWIRKYEHDHKQCHSLVLMKATRTKAFTSTCWTNGVRLFVKFDYCQVNFSCFLQQMDNAVYTFEQIFNQCLEANGGDDMCKTIQRCQDRVLKVKRANLTCLYCNWSTSVNTSTVTYLVELRKLYWIKSVHACHGHTQEKHVYDALFFIFHSNSNWLVWDLLGLVRVSKVRSQTFLVKCLNITLLWICAI